MRAFPLVAAACALALVASPEQRKKKEEETQTLQLPKELPTAITGDTRHLNFLVTPLSSKGLLSQQVRDGLKALAHLAGGDRVLKIRAFVAGSGDLRRVRDLVSEDLTDRKQPLPVLSLIQSGGLPMEGAQVEMEGIVLAERSEPQWAGVTVRGGRQVGSPTRPGGPAHGQSPGAPPARSSSCCC